MRRRKREASALRTPSIIQFALRCLHSLLRDWTTHVKPWSVFIHFAEWSIAGFRAWVFSYMEGQVASVPTFPCLWLDAKSVFISCLDNLGIPSAPCGTVEDFQAQYLVEKGAETGKWEMITYTALSFAYSGPRQHHTQLDTPLQFLVISLSPQKPASSLRTGITTGSVSYLLRVSGSEWAKWMAY